ncbi:MAG: ACT domain-containing protein [Thermodesulfobacteriota bacterium]
MSSFPSPPNRLGANVLGPLAHNQINLPFLTYVGRSRELAGIAAFCTAGAGGDAGYTLAKTQGAASKVQFHRDTCILTLFPHDKRPEIIGNFISSLSRAKILLYGLASSAAAISAVLPGRARHRAVQALFRRFAFSGYATPDEFYAAQILPEQALREVVAAYQEKVIKIYCIVDQPDLELWELALPSATALADLGLALIALGDRGFRLPFLVALPEPEGRLLINFSLVRRGAPEVELVLHSHLPGVTARRRAPVAAIFLHGPHFGDRYGIADTLVQALETAQVQLLALSCTVSSISAVIRQEDLAGAVKVLGETFEAQYASGSGP